MLKYNLNILWKPGRGGVGIVLPPLSTINQNTVATIGNVFESQIRVRLHPCVKEFFLRGLELLFGSVLVR